MDAVRSNRGKKPVDGDPAGPVSASAAAPTVSVSSYSEAGWCEETARRLHGHGIDHRADDRGGGQRSVVRPQDIGHQRIQ